MKTDGHVVRDTGTPPRHCGAPRNQPWGQEMGSLKETQKRKKSPDCRVRNKINSLEPNRARILSRVMVRLSVVSECEPRDRSPPGASVRGTLQMRTAGWVALPSSGGSFQLRDQTHLSCVSCLGKWVLHHWRHLGRVQKGSRVKPDHC